jgi:hypothetical protein
VTETKQFHKKIDEFINNSLNTSAAQYPRLVASFGLLLSACTSGILAPPTTY